MSNDTVQICRWWRTVYRSTFWATACKQTVERRAMDKYCPRCGRPIFFSRRLSALYKPAPGGEEKG